MNLGLNDMGAIVIVVSYGMGVKCSPEYLYTNNDQVKNDISLVAGIEAQ